MTNNNSQSIIYNYYDKVTGDIINKWATQYAEEHKCTFDYAMVVTLLEIHKRGAKK